MVNGIILINGLPRSGAGQIPRHLPLINSVVAGADVALARVLQAPSCSVGCRGARPDHPPGVPPGPRGLALPATARGIRRGSEPPGCETLPKPCSTGVKVRVCCCRSDRWAHGRGGAWAAGPIGARHEKAPYTAHLAVQGIICHSAPSYVVTPVSMSAAELIDSPRSNFA